MTRRIDVMKSLARSAALGVGDQLERLGLASAIKDKVGALLSRKLFVEDAQLTAAVARVSGVIAATVSTREGRIRVDVSFGSGADLQVSFVPSGVAFAPHGAKEWIVHVEPGGSAIDPHCGDVFAALAGEVAMTLWGPFIRNKSMPGKISFASRDGENLIVDLRTLPPVRAALSQRLTATVIDALSLRAIEAEEGGLRLIPALIGMP